MRVTPQMLVSVILIALLAGCSDEGVDSTIYEAELGELLDRSRKNLVFIEGGTFMLGDVGVLTDDPYTVLYDNNKPPVEISVDSFSISKYETTWGEFMVYLNDVGRASEYTRESGFTSSLLPIKSVDDPLSPNFIKKPARSPNYREAEGYCEWLAKKSGLPFALPTEAQWEYAARDRGKDVPYATNDGTLKNDKYLQRPERYVEPETPPSGNALSHSSRTKERRPVGSYPPSPLGLYDMTGNLAEWTQDWYDPDAYQHIETTNPDGPAKPVDPEQPEKVVRDWAGHGEHVGGGDTVFVRSGQHPLASSNGFRCVVNQSEPIDG